LKKQLFVLALLLLWGCSGSDTKTDEVKVSKDEKSSGKPSYTLKFEEDLRFGAENQDPNYQWALNTTSVSTDSAGNMYVSDPRENRVLMFDPQGGFIKQVAKKGDGPGEFNGLMGFSARSNSSGIALDMGGGQPTLSTFDTDQGFQNMTRNEGKPAIIQSVVFDPTADRFASFFVQPDGDAGVLLYKSAVFDSSFNIVKDFPAASGPLPNRSRFGDATYWSERIAENLTRFFKGFPVFNFDAEGNLYTAETNKYTITKWSKDFSSSEAFTHTPPTRITRDSANQDAIVELFTSQLAADPDLAQLVTASVVKRGIESAEIPLYKNPVFGIIPMEDGTLLVVHDIDFTTGENTADIFSAKGDCLGEVKMANYAFATITASGYAPRMSFRNGFAYTIETDNAGDQSVVRYRYKLVANE